MLLALVVAFIPFNYFLQRTPKCGPHEGQEIMNSFETTADKGMPYAVKVGISYALNGVILLPLFCLAMLYLSYVRKGRKRFQSRSKSLKTQLLKEVSEKKQILMDYNIKL